MAWPSRLLGRPRRRTTSRSGAAAPGWGDFATRAPPPAVAVQRITDRLADQALGQVKALEFFQCAVEPLHHHPAMRCPQCFPSGFGAVDLLTRIKSRADS